MKRPGLAVVATLAISAAAASTLTAQHQHPRLDAPPGTGSGMMHESLRAMMHCPMIQSGMGMDMGMEMEMAMPGTGQPSPDVLLRLAEPLGLAPEQIERLEAIRDRTGGTGQHMVMAHTAMAQAGLEARAVLTPDQLSRLELGMRIMREMMGGSMTAGTMMGGSGMHGMRRDPDGSGWR